MVEPSDFLRVVIDPGCLFLTGIMAKEMGTPEAKVMLLAIAMQESNLEHRRQVDSADKPMDTLASGFWRFESGGGVYGVMTHAASSGPAKTVCTKLAVPFTTNDIHELIAGQDYLAVTFARLLLFTDAAPLPSVGDKEAAFQCYLRNWRPKGWESPSQEKIDRWAKFYPLAVSTVTAAAMTQAVPFIQPKPGTLTSKAEGGVVQVDLPTMNRSWTTGSFWMAAGSGVLSGLILLAPLLEPAMDRLDNSKLLAAVPLGLGPVLYAVAREWYRAQRVKYAAEVAAAQAKPQS